jgi:hypothetical protein
MFVTVDFWTLVGIVLMVVAFVVVGGIYLYQSVVDGVRKRLKKIADREKAGEGVES